MASAGRLAAVISAEFDDARYRADLASIAGARSDEALASWIDELCRAQLGQEVIGARFACKSVGAVFGLTLADTTAVVLKLFPATFDACHPRFLRTLTTTFSNTRFGSGSAAISWACAVVIASRAR